MTVANYYLISFSLSLVICFITSFVFLKFNVVDKPDGIRKIHEGEISYGGGLAIFLSILITCLVLLDHKDLLFEGIFEIGFISFAILINSQGFRPPTVHIDKINTFAKYFRAIPSRKHSCAGNIFCETVSRFLSDFLTVIIYRIYNVHLVGCGLFFGIARP